MKEEREWMRRFLRVAFAVLTLGTPLAVQTQTTPAVEDEASKNANKAHKALDAMVQALGGDAWMNIKSQERQGHMAGFYNGEPDPGTIKVWDIHSWPDKDRLEFTAHRDVLQFYLGREGWEVTYRGKKALPNDQVDDFLRRRDHSIETAIKVWLKDPKTILVYEGQHLAERHLAEQVTLISAQNEAITILMDVQTHLPLRRTFQWRDPVYKDKNLDAEEYDDYHVVDGFPTPLTITRFKNDDMTRQLFLDKVTYNRDLPPDFWSVDAAEHRIKK
jgi:hypothetical protein